MFKTFKISHVSQIKSFFVDFLSLRQESFVFPDTIDTFSIPLNYLWRGRYGLEIWWIKLHFIFRSSIFTALRIPPATNDLLSECAMICKQKLNFPRSDSTRLYASFVNLDLAIITHLVNFNLHHIIVPIGNDTGYTQVDVHHHETRQEERAFEKVANNGSIRR